MFGTKKTILQNDFQIGRAICKSAGQFANWPDWQIGRNISIGALEDPKKLKTLMLELHFRKNT